MCITGRECDTERCQCGGDKQEDEKRSAKMLKNEA